jgi:hypothetical protein
MHNSETQVKSFKSINFILETKSMQKLYTTNVVL